MIKFYMYIESSQWRRIDSYHAPWYVAFYLSNNNSEM